jgi:hypothetical protein
MFLTKCCDSHNFAVSKDLKMLICLNMECEHGLEPCEVYGVADEDKVDKPKDVDTK